MDLLLNNIITEFENLNSGEIFLLKELFKGYEWNRLSRNVRVNLNILFQTEIRKNPYLTVTVLAKNPSNKQKYKKN